MVKNKNIKNEDTFSEVEGALTKTEQFIEDNQKIITIVIGVAVVIVAAYLSFTKLYIQPREVDAQEQMFMAEQYFEKDSFNLAINGDGNYLGFLDIIEDYGMTKAGNLSLYYTGVSYLKLGQFEDAIEYLEGFSTEDILLAPVATGAKGDAYIELGETGKALSAYEKAYKFSDNEFSTPIFMMKAATLLESEGEAKKALALYKEIKEKYPTTAEGRSIDKYIARAELKLNK